MISRLRLSLTLAAAALVALGSGAKKQLDHSSFDDWKSLRIAPLSNNGDWAAYTAKAQEGDSYVELYNTRTGKRILIPRGDAPLFTADGKWCVAKINPLFSQTRDAKIKKKKDFDLPQDTLAIVNLSTGRVEKIPNVISFKLGEKGGSSVAYLSCDTARIKPADLNDKEAGKPLVVRHLPTGREKTVKWVDSYAVSKDGSKVAFRQHPAKSDTLATAAVGYIVPTDTTYTLVSMDFKHYGEPVWSDQGDRIAYTASNDTIDASGTRAMELFMATLGQGQPKVEEIFVRQFERKGPTLAYPHADDPERQAELEARWREAQQRALGKELFVNQYSKPKFSEDGRRLIVGIAPFRAANDTTIVDFETPTLDIWRWDAPYTPPQENKMVDKMKEMGFPVVVDLATRKNVLTYTEPLARLETADDGRWVKDWVLIHDPSEGFESRTWDYAAPKKLYVKNISTGETREVGTVPRDEAVLAPDGKFVVWFDTDRRYRSYNIETGETAVISDGVPYPLWKEEQDTPLYRQACIDPIFTLGDERVIVADKHDLWALDMNGNKAPVCITAGDGRKNNRRYRYVKTDKEELAVAPGQTMLLDVLDLGDKRQGLATLVYSGKASAPILRVLDTYEFWNVNKAKDADVFAFRKSNFETSPDMWIARGYDFRNARRVSDINPQMKDYSWGTAQLVKWHAYNGVETEGVLYLPDDFDASKSYPMMVVFYETGSEHLYHHYQMEPSWSWINYPFYVSRGYVVFQPDVHYTPGVPGEGAYNSICSGVEEVCRLYPQIDRKRIGIDGQSWGGYQTAYLVTRTDMFACAGSGAPVSNMTSAFGGIRWGTGDSRMAQYEQGQSRIGRTLWEAPELYIANSPLFYADRVNTPLLIMHNDNDGAVPWYQGIELFMALRRLHKPVWMLTYNGEEHNIIERRNRKDITVRLQQFFDHYLKGDPMPRWMKEGIPSTRKGQDLAY